MDYKTTIRQLELKLDRQKANVKATEDHLRTLRALDSGDPKQMDLLLKK